MKVTEKIEITNEDNMALMSRYEDNYFDLAIVDPPYGIKRFEKNVESKKMPNFKNKLTDWDRKPKQEYWDELFRISKNQIVWGANNFNMPTSEYFCIWDKKQPMDNFARCEYAWVSMGLKKPAKIFELAYWGGMKHSVEKNYHPTQKPVKLYEWLFKNYSKPGDKIIDTNLGSGSIAIALDNMNKIEKMDLTLTACELDEEYYNNAIKRIKQQCNQMTIF
jgi:site-specific DNA-methyltransferase (adenine-specific)